MCTQVEPDIDTEASAGERRNQVSEKGAGAALLLPNVKLLDHREVDKNEPYEGAEIQQLDRGLKIHIQRAHTRRG